MIKKVLTLIYFCGVSIGALAQSAVSGKLSPFKDYSYALLYKLDGMEQKFIDNTSLVNGEFQFDLSSKGVYRVVFDLQKGVYLDVFSAGESIAFELNPANPSNSYGRLYTWEQAMKVCPSGWHLPSDEEWKEAE